MGCAKSKNGGPQTPWPLTSISRQEWIAWRNCFLTYMNEKAIPPYKQGHYFVQFIGNIGTEISKNSYYPTTLSQADIDVILFKFDVYFIFGGRKRHNNESIDEYIAALKVVAEKTGKTNTEKVIKEKILQDLVTEKIFDQFSKITPSFSKITNYESLALHELLFIWEEIRKTFDINQYAKNSIQNKHKGNLENSENNCLQCNEEHNSKECTASDEKFQECSNDNHSSKCCTNNYIHDCISCGSNHPRDKCPAFDKECSICKKTCHFSWQCYIESLVCESCGQNHVQTNQKCPAIDSMCNKCNNFGHFTFKCHRKGSIRKK